MSSEPSVARPASTILLLRDRADGFDVFMMVRHYQIEFASGALVFPGGSVDAADRDIIARPELFVSAEADCEPALEFRIAAIRETFEESGILLARPRGSDQLVAASRAAEIEASHRTALCEGKISFAEILADNQLVMALDLLVPYARWITPEKLPKRFDTWFFLAEAPPEQLGMHDGKESTDSIWLSPNEAIEGGESGRFTLPFPTTRNLIRLGKQLSVRQALEASRGQPIVTVMPILSRDGDKRTLRIPAEAGYDGEVFEFTGS
ncbi:NUDIX hydrolase [Rhodopseudomonas palustris BisB5]|uniref:NUDIX hydrolase n=1 Tax=Rhodopseudomonas palustris (strain BisB5) TaxID=316057 RepID=Q135A2_RHOPS|nr:NUDIX hydrolase [Rhodopseudomonas palustris BisB5]